MLTLLPGYDRCFLVLKNILSLVLFILFNDNEFVDEMHDVDEPCWRLKLKGLAASRYLLMKFFYFSNCNFHYYFQIVMRGRLIDQKIEIWFVKDCEILVIQLKKNYSFICSLLQCNYFSLIMHIVTEHFIHILSFLDNEENKNATRIGKIFILSIHCTSYKTLHKMFHGAWVIIYAASFTF